METVVYQITAADLDLLIESIYIAVIIIFVIFRIGGFLIDLIDRLLLSKKIRYLEEKEDLLLSEINDLITQKTSLEKELLTK
ncbi:hypothetical protein F0249_07850 [Vibrio sp. 03-59-1]|uniref:hypothetical protein n=1 Tax=Vibrio sp. 03-59-1 TaxID=2607607 RepID=UPI0014934B6F|nr:hypothetical protein [Vibrio sp. 03-59-1]NOH83722.1 hypothetical protein [Vibrio sp. 03-59-1]